LDYNQQEVTCPKGVKKMGEVEETLISARVTPKTTV